MNPKNTEFTLEELIILAENGQKDLQYAVGHYYEYGIHTEVNYEKAADRKHISKPSVLPPQSPGKHTKKNELLR